MSHVTFRFTPSLTHVLSDEEDGTRGLLADDVEERTGGVELYALGLGRCNGTDKVAYQGDGSGLGALLVELNAGCLLHLADKGGDIAELGELSRFGIEGRGHAECSHENYRMTTNLHGRTLKKVTGVKTVAAPFALISLNIPRNVHVFAGKIVTLHSISNRNKKNNGLHTTY